MFAGGGEALEFVGSVTGDRSGLAVGVGALGQAGVTPAGAAARGCLAVDADQRWRSFGRVRSGASLPPPYQMGWPVAVWWLGRPTA
jgi:hypothetical protein